MSDKTHYPPRRCPIHGTVMRQCGPNYYCVAETDEVTETERLKAENAALLERVREMTKPKENGHGR